MFERDSKDQMACTGAYQQNRRRDKKTALDMYCVEKDPVLWWRPEGRRATERSTKTWRGTVNKERWQAGWNDRNTVRAVARDRT